VRVWDCTQLDTDGITCLSGQWVEYSAGWPALTWDQVAELSGAVALLFATAFVVRVVAHFLKNM